jgi:hypothetical protein
MTIYCYDTEFVEDGRTIELISIGIVCEDGREYYAVNSDMDVERVTNDQWLLENVWRHLPLDDSGQLDVTDTRVKPKSVIANEVRDFLLSSADPGAPELWAYFAAYDHVALAQLWGKLIDLPKGIPKYTHDLRQEMDRLWVASSAVPKPPNAHDALADARWNLEMLQAIRQLPGG